MKAIIISQDELNRYFDTCVSRIKLGIAEMKEKTLDPTLKMTMDDLVRSCVYHIVECKNEIIK